MAQPKKRSIQTARGWLDRALGDIEVARDSAVIKQIAAGQMRDAIAAIGFACQHLGLDFDQIKRQASADVKASGKARTL